MELIFAHQLVPPIDKGFNPYSVSFNDPDESISRRWSVIIRKLRTALYRARSHECLPSPVVNDSGS